MGFSNPILGGNVLVRPAIQSPNFSQTDKTGWAVDANGNAFFFSVTVGGTISGADFLAYEGTPGAGTLVGSISGNGGTDAFGNQYQAGLSFQNGAGNTTLESVSVFLIALGNSLAVTNSNVATLQSDLASMNIPFLQGLVGKLPHQTTSNATAFNATNFANLCQAVNNLMTNLQAGGYQF